MVLAAEPWPQNASALQQDPAGFSEIIDSQRGIVDCAAVVRMGLAKQLTKTTLHPGASKTVSWQPEDVQCPQDRIRAPKGGPSDNAPRVAQVVNELRTDATLPAQPPTDRVAGGSAMIRVQAASGVDRTEHAGGSGAILIEFEQQLLAGAHESVAEAGQPDPILLQPVPQPRLGDPVTGLYLADQVLQLAEEVSVDVRHEGGRNTAQKETPKPRRGSGRQHRDPKSDAACGGDRTGVEDLEFGQQHPDTLAAER